MAQWWISGLTTARTWVQTQATVDYHCKQEVRWMKWPSRKRIPHPFAIRLVNDADTIYIDRTHRRYFPLLDQGRSAWEQLYFVHVLGKHCHQSDIPQSGVDRALRSIYRGVPALSGHRTRLTDRWNTWKIHQKTFIYHQNKVKTSSKSYIAMPK